MYSLVMALALTSAPETPGFHPKQGPYCQYPYGWPCLANFCGKDRAYNPYWYSGTHTFYANYYSCFGISIYPQPYIPSAFNGPTGGCANCTPNGGMPMNSGGFVVPDGKFSPATRTTTDPSKKTAPGVPTSTSPAKPQPRPETTISQTSGETFQAEIVLDVPENAALFVNGTALRKGSGLRTFTTPALPKNARHFYDFKIEVVKDGKKEVTERTVEVAPGRMELAGLFRKENELAYSPRREAPSSDGSR